MIQCLQLTSLTGQTSVARQPIISYSKLADSRRCVTRLKDLRFWVPNLLTHSRALLYSIHTRWCKSASAKEINFWLVSLHIAERANSLETTQLIRFAPYCVIKFFKRIPCLQWNKGLSCCNSQTHVCLNHQMQNSNESSPAMEMSFTISYFLNMIIQSWNNYL